MPGKKLTDLAIKSLKPKDKPYKVSDGTIGGLFVAVATSGRKVFRLGFKFQGKVQQLTLCSYPEFSLADAREMALAAKKQIAHGLNPAALKQEKKAVAKAGTVTSRVVVDDWLAIRKPEPTLPHVPFTVYCSAFPRKAMPTRPGCRWRRAPFCKTLPGKLLAIIMPSQDST